VQSRSSCKWGKWGEAMLNMGGGLLLTGGVGSREAVHTLEHS
jgi:hypothetical protein